MVSIKNPNDVNKKSIVPIISNGGHTRRNHDCCINDTNNKSMNNDLSIIPFYLLLQPNTINPKVSSSMDDTVPLQQQQQEEEHQQQSHRLLEQLIQYGVAMIDISTYNTNIDSTSTSDRDRYNNPCRDSSNNCCSNNGDCSIPSKAFAIARKSMDQLNQQQQQQFSESQHERVINNGWTIDCPMILPNCTIDAAHVYGYHTTGGMISSRYNMFREGLIFSDNQSTFDIRTITNNTNDNASQASATTTTFKNDCYDMFQLLHTVADTVLTHIGNHLELTPNDGAIDPSNIDKNNNWFQNQYGPTIDHCQWHMKRYTASSDNQHMNQNNNIVLDGNRNETNDNNYNKYDTDVPNILLPTHTDPSLVSIVILDQPHIQSGAMGLQFLTASSSTSSSSTTYEWVDVPYSGHDIAIVLIGSVLQYITCGYFKAVKHRVIQSRNNTNMRSDTKTILSQKQQQQRVAATLFCRPKPSSILIIPPSSKIKNITSSSSSLTTTTTTKPITFAQWITKTSKNYQKSIHANNKDAKRNDT